VKYIINLITFTAIITVVISCNKDGDSVSCEETAVIMTDSDFITNLRTKSLDSIIISSNQILKNQGYAYRNFQPISVECSNTGLIVSSSVTVDDSIKNANIIEYVKQYIVKDTSYWSASLEIQETEFTNGRIENRLMSRNGPIIETGDSLEIILELKISDSTSYLISPKVEIERIE